MTDRPSSLQSHSADSQLIGMQHCQMQSQKTSNIKEVAISILCYIILQILYISEGNTVFFEIQDSNKTKRNDLVLKYLLVKVKVTYLNSNWIKVLQYLILKNTSASKVIFLFSNPFAVEIYQFKKPYFDHAAECNLQSN